MHITSFTYPYSKILWKLWRILNKRGGTKNSWVICFLIIGSYYVVIRFVYNVIYDSIRLNLKVSDKDWSFSNEKLFVNAAIIWLPSNSIVADLYCRYLYKSIYRAFVFGKYCKKSPSKKRCKGGFSCTCC